MEQWIPVDERNLNPEFYIQPKYLLGISWKIQTFSDKGKQFVASRPTPFPNRRKLVTSGRNNLKGKK